jgi:vancomycin resistance protein YoaR
MDRAGDDGEILGRVSVGGMQIGGLDLDDATAAMTALEASLGAEPIVVTIEGTSFDLLPSQVGFNIDEQSLVSAAMEQGREGGFFGEMAWWISHIGGGSTAEIPIQGTYNRGALINLLKLWESEAIGQPPQEGGITVQGSTIVPIYPSEGYGVDLEATADLIEKEIFGARNPVTALTDFLDPVLTNEDIDNAVARATLMTGQPITLAKILPDISFVIPPDVLIQSIASRVVGPENDPDLELFFQIGSLVEYLNPLRAEVETDPIDAQIVIRPDNVPLILPGSNGVKVDDGNLPAAVMRAATSVTRTAPLPVRDGDPPGFTTEDAEALGIKELLYEATTFYNCCGDWKNQNRVINIHRIADETNGAIVMPGETFSLNQYVGKRTIEDGYRQAGAILGPVVYCCDHFANVGGGVSQFGTTFYNAVFFSGFEDVNHTPHTLYFSRYPMVREATLGYPEPDVVFRNNSDAAVYIRATYTDSSVSVAFFGDTPWVSVTSTTSERMHFTEPGIYYDGSYDVMPGDSRQSSAGTPGFTATVVRTVTWPDGREEKRRWTWTYDPHPVRIVVHPCEVPPTQYNYDPTIECPVQVPAVLNQTKAAAQTAIVGAGFVYAEGTPFITGDAGLVGKVYSQTPSPGTWLDPGSVVTVRIYQLA